MAKPTQRALYELEEERRILVQDSERIQIELGRSKSQRRRRYRQGDPRVTRDQLKAELSDIVVRLRTVNQEIKSERRRLTTILEEGSPRPRTAFQYMVALYRMFDDAVPADQRSPDENALMRRARDFVMTGRAEHG